MIYYKLAAVAAAFCVAAYASVRVALNTIGNNRAVEFDENERQSNLSDAQIRWTVIHIRDDIGAIHNLLVVANGLLAALVVASFF